MRSLIALCGLVLLVVAWLLWLIYTPSLSVSQEAQPASQAAISPKSEDNPAKASEQPALSVDVPSEQSQTDAESAMPELTDADQQTQDEGEPTCVSSQALQADPRYTLLLDWFDSELGFGKQALADQYGWYNESALLEAAELGDAGAMLALGMNYAAYASSEHFVSDKLYPVDAPQREPKPKALDKMLLAKAEYWLYQAALHGKLAGLTELQMLTFEQRASLDKNDLQVESKRKALLVKAVAYRSLFAHVVPDSLKPFITLERKVQAQDKQRYELIYHNLLRQWRQDREVMGFETKVDVDVPKGMVEILELSGIPCKETP